MLAHLSDLHLGYGGAGGEGDAGEIREVDVRDAFLRAVRGIVRLRPDLILFTGDLFDDPHPGPGALATLLQGLKTLADELPRTPVLVLAGSRDTPPLPGSGPGPLALLDALPGVQVAAGALRSVLLADAAVHVCMVPHAALWSGSPATPMPDPSARWNVLAMHALAGGGEGAVLVDPQAWDWVALGGDHRGRSPSPGIRWAGSLERVSADPWREAGEEKGFLTVDLASGSVMQHPFPGRPLVEVAPIHRGRQGLPRVNARIRTAVEAVPGGIDGKLVRLRVHGLTPEDRLALDGAWLSVIRRRAAHLQLQLRTGEDPPGLGGVPAFPERRGIRALVGGTARDRQALLLEWRGEGVDGLPAPPAPADRAVSGDDEVIWGGAGPEEPEVFLEWALKALAAAGGGHVSSALPGQEEGGSAGSSGESAPSSESDSLPDGGAPPEPAALGASFSSRSVDSPQAAGPAPPSGEDRLLSLRADAVEVDGEVEALTVEWLRERQDAETQLQSHRDRARELRDRIRAMEGAGTEGPCPVCGRPLADHLEEVLATFREEWDALVQDGRWWRRRREQLEPKPEALREMEIRGMRLHAELEAAAEASEVGPPPAGQGVGAGGESSEWGPRETAAALPAAEPDGQDARLRAALLGRASDLLNRLTDGALAGIVERNDRLLLVADGRLLPLAATCDRAVVRLALHLALVELALERGAPPATLRLGVGVTALDPGAASRMVELLRRLSRHLPGVVLDAGAELVRRRADRFDGIVELRPGADAAGRPLLRLHPGGRVRVRLGPGVPG